jgi:hypothetical protein
MDKASDNARDMHMQNFSHDSLVKACGTMTGFIQCLME